MQEYQIYTEETESTIHSESIFFFKSK